MSNNERLQNTSTGLNEEELSLLSPALRSLFLDTTPIFDKPFTNESANKSLWENNFYRKEATLINASVGVPDLNEVYSFDTPSERPREVEYYGFRTVKFDGTQREGFFDIKTGEIAFGSEEIIEAVPLDAIQSFKQVGEPTRGFMETKELAPWRQKVDACATLIEKASNRIAIGSVIVGASAGLVSFIFPPALSVAGFFFAKSLYPALAYYASIGVRKALHFEKQVKFECITKPELFQRKNIAGVRFTGILPTKEFNAVAEQLSSSSSSILI